MNIRIGLGEYILQTQYKIFLKIQWGGLNSLQTPLWVRQCFYHYCVVLMTCVLGTCESFFCSNRIFESNQPYIPRKPLHGLTVRRRAVQAYNMLTTSIVNERELCTELSTCSFQLSYNASNNAIVRLFNSQSRL